MVSSAGGDSLGPTVSGTTDQQQRPAQEGRALTPSTSLPYLGPWLVTLGTGSTTILEAGNLTLKVVRFMTMGGKGSLV